MNIELAAGTLLDKGSYSIIRKLKQGGFAITYLAEQLKSSVHLGYEKKVVIKELFYTQLCSRDRAGKRVIIAKAEDQILFGKLINKIVEEGKILRGLSHPHIVKTHKIFQENDTAYIVLEYIEGVDLEQLLKKDGKLLLRKAVRYIVHVLRALSEMHSKGILHLDIKPSNILIRDGSDEAVLIDFGASLAYNLEDNKVQTTNSRLVSGISHYAPLEQHALEHLKYFNATLDTYSVGSTFLHCLTGKLPPSAASLSSGMSVLPEIASAADNDSDYFPSLIKKALSTRYIDRFGSAVEFLHALQNESAYNHLMEAGRSSFNDRLYTYALALLGEAASLLTITPSIVALQKDINKALQDVNPEKEFKSLMEAGAKLQQCASYYQALLYYEQANQMVSNRIECLERIQECKQILEEESEVTALLVDAGAFQKEQKAEDLTMMISEYHSIPFGTKVEVPSARLGRMSGRRIGKLQVQGLRSVQSFLDRVRKINTKYMWVWIILLAGCAIAGVVMMGRELIFVKKEEQPAPAHTLSKPVSTSQGNVNRKREYEKDNRWLLWRDSVLLKLKMIEEIQNRRITNNPPLGTRIYKDAIEDCKKLLKLIPDSAQENIMLVKRYQIRLQLKFDTVQSAILVAEASRVFKNGNYKRACDNYIRANKLVPGSGDKGYYEFVEKARKMEVYTGCEGLIKWCQYAKQIKNTSEVRALIEGCKQE
ncbi:MAG: serine/threonine protein kinase [Williamsia sp.]|nr:serine/threonine protein kinase [Williamsia sp.]